jgi:hypothetical protein
MATSKCAARPACARASAVAAGSAIRLGVVLAYQRFPGLVMGNHAF